MSLTKSLLEAPSGDCPLCITQVGTIGVCAAVYHRIDGVLFPIFTSGMLTGLRKSHLCNGFVNPPTGNGMRLATRVLSAGGAYGR